MKTTTFPANQQTTMIITIVMGTKIRSHPVRKGTYATQGFDGMPLYEGFTLSSLEGDCIKPIIPINDLPTCCVARGSFQRVCFQLAE